MSALSKDTWIYPNILLFYPEMARHILKYRIRTLEGALLNAKQQGYKVSKQVIVVLKCVLLFYTMKTF